MPPRSLISSSPYLSISSVDIPGFMNFPSSSCTSSSSLHDSLISSISLWDLIVTAILCLQEPDDVIKNIFYSKAPLHDGALIIRSGRIAAAGCVLPLTKSTNLSKELGMRHRAGIGLSEQSDAVVVIVSEETGSISVAIDGMLKRHLNAATLERLLRKELIIEEEDKDLRGIKQLMKKLFKGKTASSSG